ncbi:hypothetical protein [Gilvimarinus sp. 1_MG-2023]|uniref:hypothetical protein n=1 Tax=Gilvimarinus sp. 1_MG-2023 TaxID=3062638 RepID=UPI0026E46045|nr:hypothetical protein [Gilvimarinus sp. 1_MG-2023]MDO6747167.1 hypothetical protein [Gilvimarinus sp. 1_MG-2023]
MSMISVHPIRTLSKADIAQALELLEHGLPLERVARLANVRPEHLASCIKRAKAFGFDAWDPKFMNEIAQAV